MSGEKKKKNGEVRQRRRRGGDSHIVVGGAEYCAISGNRNARDRDILFRDKLMRTVVLGQIPDAHTTAAVAADDLALVGVDHDIVDGTAVVVAALDGTGARLPDLDGTVLGARDHPLALAVEGDARDVAGMAIKGQ